jgi:hypothetical protein
MDTIALVKSGASGTKFVTSAWNGWKENQSVGENMINDTYVSTKREFFQIQVALQALERINRASVQLVHIGEPLETESRGSHSLTVNKRHVVSL